jgi:hypothetical protein
MGRAPPVVSPSQARHQGRPIRPARIGAGDRDGNRHARGRPRPERPSATRTPDQKGKKHLRQEADPRLGAGEQTDGTGAWGADHRGRARAGFAPLRGPGARLHIRKKPPSVHPTVDNPHRRCSALVSRVELLSCAFHLATTQTARGIARKWCGWAHQRQARPGHRYGMLA